MMRMQQPLQKRAGEAVEAIVRFSTPRSEQGLGLELSWTITSTTAEPALPEKADTSALIIVVRFACAANLDVSRFSLQAQLWQSGQVKGSPQGPNLPCSISQAETWPP